MRHANTDHREEGDMYGNDSNRQVYTDRRKATRVRKIAEWVHGTRSQEYADALLNEAVSLVECDVIALTE